MNYSKLLRSLRCHPSLFGAQLESDRVINLIYKCKVKLGYAPSYRSNSIVLSSD